MPRHPGLAARPIQPRPSVLSASPRRLVRGISPPRFPRRPRQLPPSSLIPSSHPTPPASDRLEPCPTAPRSFRPVSHPRPCSMTARCHPLLRSESTGARPVLRTGRRALFRRARLRPARLHEARLAVFALRVTIPAAFAPFGRCALRLRVRPARPVHHRRRGSVAPLPSPAALSNLRDSRITARRFAPPPLALASPPLGASQSPHGLATGSALPRHRRCSSPFPISTASQGRHGSSPFERYRTLSRPALRAMALRTGRCLPQKPWHSPRTSRPYGQATRPCR